MRREACVAQAPAQSGSERIGCSAKRERAEDDVRERLSLSLCSEGLRFKAVEQSEHAGHTLRHAHASASR